MKTFFVSLLFTFTSSMAFAQSLLCKVEYGVRVQEVEITNNNNTFDVYFDGQRQLGFQCLSKSNAEHFQDVVRCVSPNGSAIHVFNTKTSRPNATFIDRYNPKMLMTCFEN